MDTIAPIATAPAQRKRKRFFLLRWWKTLRTMRMALILLLVLAAAASIGSFIPQRPVNDLAVFRWIQARPALGGFLDHLGFFDVFGAAWFMAIYGLIIVSLIGCILPRYRAYWRVIRSRPKPGVRGAHDFEGTTALAPADAIAAVERAFRARRWRTQRFESPQGSGVAAERGRWREGGSLVFHTAFLLLLLAIGIGKGYGFSGQVAVVEGDTFFDTHVAYDSIREGGLFGNRHRNFALKVTDFNVTFRPGGAPKDFISRVELTQGSRRIADTDIRVNNPLVYKGVSVFQLAWGWAPRVVVTQNGKPLADSHVVFLPDGDAWRGVVKIPQTKPQQTGLELFFFPDLSVGKDNLPHNASPEAKRPVIFYEQYVGDLGLNAPQSVYYLDKTRMARGAFGAIPKGAKSSLPGNIEVSFPDLKQYSVFQVAADPGQAIALIAAALILVGLIPALYSSRRRVWVRAIADGETSRVTVSGLALQRKGAFEQEFSSLVRDIGRHLNEKKER